MTDLGKAWNSLIGKGETGASTNTVTETPATNYGPVIAGTVMLILVVVGIWLIFKEDNVK